MTLSHETMLELMQYADGELDGEARARVEALLRTSEDARKVVEAMGVLGDVVRDGIEDRAAASPLADGIAESVMAAIALGGAIGAGSAAASGTSMRAGAVPFAQARASQRSRGGIAAAVVTVLALAAGVVFFVTGKAPGPVAKEDIVMGSAAPSGGAETETAADETGVDLKEVRSIRNKVNVFFTPTAATPGASTSVVVWIDDHQEGQ